jgi:hypothetical protein
MWYKSLWYDFELLSRWLGVGGRENHIIYVNVLVTFSITIKNT